jgi:Ser/Thr protein kinase RdoA (MazF antagonist)
MNIEETDEILEAFGLAAATIEPFGNGLVNRTWKVLSPKGNYILQKINDSIFKKPQYIANNIGLIASYLRKNHPDYFFVSPVNTVDGKAIFYREKKGWFRLMPFVEGSLTFDVVDSTKQAYEAARQFGRFTRMLSGFDTGKLKVTVPGFHDLHLRYRQFLKAVHNGSQQKIKESKDLISALIEQKLIVDEYRNLIRNSKFRLRVTHHDTKISNVLFDQDNRGMCVIDLDTVMPGYFLSDVGDMMRTYLSPVGEEETDLEKITIRNEFYEAIVEGYSSEMGEDLTEVEKKSFLFAGKFMIYMQALRFLTDHLNNDIYYGSKYEGHNLIRARNQATLLKHLSRLKAIA